MKCSKNHLMFAVSLFVALSPLSAFAKGLGSFGGLSSTKGQARLMPSQGSVFKKSQGSLGNVIKKQGPILSTPASTGGLGKYNDKIGSVIKKHGPILGQPTTSGKYGDKIGDVIKKQGPILTQTPTNPAGKYKDKIGDIIKKQGPILTQTPTSPAGKYKDKIGDIIKKQGPILTQTPTSPAGKYKDKLGDILKDPGPIFGGAGSGTGGAGGGAPPIDPGKGGGGTPPMDPGTGSGSGNCGSHCNWPLPIPFPIGGWGGYGGGSGGGVYSEPVAQASYEQVVQAPVPVAEVQPAAISAPLDLELLEVRQLDRGTADAGPAYRVTLRNKSGEAVNQAFHVVLAASISRQPSRDAAFATAEVRGMEAGAPVSVDLRLPAKALSLGQNADGQAVPFTWLTALVDSHQELPQVTRENDFATLNRAEIAMVAQP